MLCTFIKVFDKRNQLISQSIYIFLVVQFLLLFYNYFSYLLLTFLLLIIICYFNEKILNYISPGDASMLIAF